MRSSAPAHPSHTNRQIAAELFVALGTAKAHVHSTAGSSARRPGSRQSSGVANSASSTDRDPEIYPRN